MRISDWSSDVCSSDLFHEKIYYLDANGSLNLDEEGHPLNNRPLDFSITKNVAAMFLSVIVLLLIFISIAKTYRKRRGKAPKGLQSVIEPLIIFVRDEIARPNIGHQYHRFMRSEEQTSELQSLMSNP